MAVPTFMTGYLLFLAGTALLLLAVVDFLRTTISLGGLGLVSSRVYRPLWKIGRSATLFAERRFGVSIRGAIGPVVLSALGANWIMLHLAAYTLFFLSGPSLVSSETGAPATLVQTLAFAGSALSTLGASTVQVTGGWWDILSMVAAVNGMVVLTLSVSFVLNIINSVTTARQWAILYNAIADPPGERRSEALARLGPELCGVVIDLTASPLTGAFIPDDPKMSFPKALKDLIDEIGDPGPNGLRHLHGVDQLFHAIELLGQHLAPGKERSDFEAARFWAEDHSIRA